MFSVIRRVGKRITEWLWDYANDMKYVGLNPLTEERYERIREKELCGLHVTE